MILSPGIRLGPYEVLSLLGTGGMGEVWLARDTRLNRTVAIKVLGSGLDEDSSMRQRFEREARAISSLNHPNVCTLHDVGRHEGFDYLVMEHVEGETLATTLAKGPLPMELCLETAIEITGALDRAHRAGVVHRDLKPGNVMLTRSGAKLLDFGLARFEGPLAGTGGLAEVREPPLTREGTILGTLQYMAPEQLRGRSSDARSDLFSFGAMLHEMITGQRAFPEREQASLIAAILERDPPPVSSLRASIPPALDRIVRRCLAKDPEDRWQSARDLMHELQWTADGGGEAASTARPRSRLRELGAWSIAGIAVLTLLAQAFVLRRFAPAAAERSFHLSMIRPPLAPYDFFDHAVLSPDGKRVVFVAYRSETNRISAQLWIRDLDADSGRPLEGTDGGNEPFWSPDSQQVAFFADGKLRRIAAVGGPAFLVCDTADGWGGAWAPDGTIVIGAGGFDGLHRIPATGGVPVPLTKLGPKEEAHRWPSFLPDGRHFVFLADAWLTDEHHLKIGSLDDAEIREVVQGVTNAVATVPGYLLYVRGSSLLAHALDPKDLSLRGEPRTIASHVAQISDNHRFEFSASTNGILAVRCIDPRNQLTWVGRSGKKLEQVGPVANIESVRLSPDGTQVAYGLLDQDGRNDSVWVLDLERKSSRHIGIPYAFAPVWSAQGDRMALSAMREGDLALYTLSPSVPGSEKEIALHPAGKVPETWSPDGRSLVYQATGSGGRDLDLWIVDPDQPKETRAWIHTPANEKEAQFSPDGRWLAYTSDESGQEEVYVVAVPLTARKWQVSTAGGHHPRWRGDASEIYFVSAVRQVMAASLRAGKELDISAPEMLFDSKPAGFSDVSPDGQRFLVVEPVENFLDSSLTVIVDWQGPILRR